MKKINNSTSEQRKKQLRDLQSMTAEDIDFSDIAELTEEQFRQARRAPYYRPLKRSITIRLDVDLIEWLKREGHGYQTKANRLLRSQMLRDLATERAELRRQSESLAKETQANASSMPVINLLMSDHPPGRAQGALPDPAPSWKQDTPAVSSRTPQTNTPPAQAAA